MSLEGAREASLVANKTRLEAEAEKFKAEAEKTRAEADEARQRTRTAAVAADLNELSLVREQEKRRDELAADRYHYVYPYNDEINRQSVKACINQLTTWTRTKEAAEIEIVFNSPGGSVIDGMALFDFIRSLSAHGHTVTTMALGYAASMAGILLQAGDRRVMGRESYLLIHEISTLTGGKIGEIEDEVKFIKKIQKRVIDIFISRSDGKISKTTFAKNWTRKDWWIDSEEALRLGFCDEVR